MRVVAFVLVLTFGGAFAQFPGASLFSVPWGQQSSGGGNYPSYGKPIRPSPFGYGGPIGNYGRPPAGGANSPVSYDDDPVPVPSSIESAFEPPEFPARLPIKAPNGVVEIYNRVVDDLIKKLKVDFEKAELDPMSVVIRSTPPGPVRVPGHLQKRPFRRPGAALYRSNKDDATGESAKSNKKNGRGSESSEEDYQYVFARRENPRSNNGEVETKTMAETNVEVPAEPSFDEYPRSDEAFSDEIPAEEVKPSPKPKAKKKKEEQVEDDESSESEGKRDQEAPLLQNRKGEHAGGKKNKDVRYKSGNVTGGGKKEEGKGPKQKPEPPYLEEEPEDDPPSLEDEDEADDFDDHEPGTLQSAGNRPLGGYYPHDGSPVIPSKPNAELRGLASMVRTSDVLVSVDARSAIITARLLVGPLLVNINSSAEPMERGVKAVIPELEAEIILMERHGVIFLQRYTLDRVYGQDVEITVPKVKTEKQKKKGGVKGGADYASGYDPMHPGAVQRYQTKMGAHLSMEVVKLLRSGNLRLQIMRIAQGTMAKVRLPIKTTQTSRKRSRKNKKKNSQKRSERE